MTFIASTLTFIRALFVMISCSMWSLLAACSLRVEEMCMFILPFMSVTFSLYFIVIPIIIFVILCLPWLLLLLFLKLFVSFFLLLLLSVLNEFLLINRDATTFKILVVFLDVLYHVLHLKIYCTLKPFFNISTELVMHVVRIKTMTITVDAFEYIFFLLFKFNNFIFCW